MRQSAERTLHLLLLLLGDDAVRLVELLEVLTGRVALQEVLERRLVEVVVDLPNVSTIAQKQARRTWWNACWAT